jgi:hypothetical protein
MKGAGMRTITTTIRPDVEIDVEEDEFLDLKRQGLIATGDDEAEKPEPKKSATDKKEGPNA